MGTYPGFGVKTAPRRPADHPNGVRTDLGRPAFVDQMRDASDLREQARRWRRQASGHAAIAAAQLVLAAEQLEDQAEAIEVTARLQAPEYTERD